MGMSTMRASERCDLPGEDLLACADGELRGARRELVEAALAAEPVCRRRLVSFQETGRLLRDGSPLVDDPTGRAAIRARLERIAGQPSSTIQLRPTVAAGALPLLLLLAVIAAGRSSLWGRYGGDPAASNPPPEATRSAAAGPRLTSAWAGGRSLAVCSSPGSNAALGYRATFTVLGLSGAVGGGPACAPVRAGFPPQIQPQLRFPVRAGAPPGWAPASTGYGQPNDARYGFGVGPSGGYVAGRPGAFNRPPFGAAVCAYGSQPGGWQAVVPGTAGACS